MFGRLTQEAEKDKRAAKTVCNKGVCAAKTVGEVAKTVGKVAKNVVRDALNDPVSNEQKRLHDKRAAEAAQAVRDNKENKLKIESYERATKIINEQRFSANQKRFSASLAAAKAANNKAALNRAASIRTYRDDNIPPTITGYTSIDTSLITKYNNSENSNNEFIILHKDNPYMIDVISSDTPEIAFKNKKTDSSFLIENKDDYFIYKKNTNNVGNNKYNDKPNIIGYTSINTSSITTSNYPENSTDEFIILHKDNPYIIDAISSDTPRIVFKNKTTGNPFLIENKNDYFIYKKNTDGGKRRKRNKSCKRTKRNKRNKYRKTRNSRT